MKFFRASIFGTAIVAIAIVVACQHEEPENDRSTEYDDAYYASLASVSSSDSHFVSSEEGGTVRFATEGGYIVLNVDCGIEWTVDNPATDLFPTSVNVSVGTLSVSAGQNTVEKEVSTELKLMTANSRITFATITVIQNAYGAPELSVDTTEWHAPAAGELSTFIGVESSLGAWEIKCSADWLSFESSDSGITITAEENPETSSRSATVTISADDGYSSASATLNVIQDAKAYISLSADSLVFYEKGQQGSVTVTGTNYGEWTWSCDKSNGFFDVTVSGNTISVTVTADNDGEEDMEGYITLTSGDGAANVCEVQFPVIEYANRPKALILEYTITANTKVQLPIFSDVNCTIIWGDGVAEDVTSNFPTHTFANAGTYPVVIEGTVTALSYENMASYNSRNYTLTAVRQWGKTGLRNMTHAFDYCTGLTSIPDDTEGAFTDVLEFPYSFRHTGISKIPDGLFTYATKATAFEYTFAGNESLLSIPEDLFAPCPEVISFDNCFRQCFALTTLPAGLFAHNTKVESFNIAFYSCQGLIEIPEELFANNVAVTSFSETFEACYALPSIPENLFANCKAVTSFNATFYHCESLKSIPDGLFANNTEAINFTDTFYLCSALTDGSFSSELFKNNTKAQIFSMTFGACNSLTTVPSGLFANNTEVTSFEGVFYRNYGIRTVPEDLFANNTKVTSFYRVFYYCTALTSVPENLFANNVNVTTFGDAFYGCSALTEIPAGIFDNNPNVLSFAEAFYGMTSLKTLPTGLFAGCGNANNFMSLCSGCTSLESIPEDLFSYNTSIMNFDFVFSNCSSLQSIPEGLFANNPEATWFELAFFNCASLTSIPTALFSNCKKAVDFYETFSGCVRLTGESPYDEMEVNEETVKVHLYERKNYTDYFTAPTSTSKCFSNCTRLSDYSSIPSSWGGGGD